LNIALRQFAKILCAVIAFSDAAYAHDFWIQPSAFRARPGQQIDLRFLIGEPGAVEHWATEWRKVVSLQDFSPHSVTDKLASIQPLDGAEPTIQRVDASFALNEVGTHIVAFTSAHAVNDLDGPAFNAYVDHEGLTLIRAHRRLQGQTGAHGREIYSRRAKALLQVGDVITNTVSQPIGQTLEIVPTINPYLLKAREPLRARILFHGRPLGGASVALESLDPQATHGAPVVSDREGMVAFPHPDAGAWKINVVWSYPITDPRAEYETIFASLSFGM
jgi:uncharacterized GH25 family protein